MADLEMNDDCCKAQTRADMEAQELTNDASIQELTNDANTLAAVSRLIEIVTTEPDRFCHAIEQYLAEGQNRLTREIDRLSEEVERLTKLFPNHRHLPDGSVVVLMENDSEPRKKKSLTRMSGGISGNGIHLTRKDSQAALDEIKYLIHIIDRSKTYRIVRSMGTEEHPLLKAGKPSLLTPEKYKKLHSELLEHKVNVDDLLTPEAYKDLFDKTSQKRQILKNSENELFE